MKRTGCVEPLEVWLPKIKNLVKRAAHWVNVSHIERADEPAWNKDRLARNLDDVRQMMAAKNLPAKPLGVTPTHDQLKTSGLPNVASNYPKSSQGLQVRRRRVPDYRATGGDDTGCA